MSTTSNSKQIQKLKDIENTTVPEGIATTVIEQEPVVSTVEQTQQEQQQPEIQTPKAQIPSIFDDIKETVIQVSQDHINEIVKDLKDGVLRLEYIDSKGKMQVDRRQYNPMTIGMNRKVVKVGKRIRLLEADIKGMGKDGALDVGKIQEKYSDILDSDVDEYDLTNEQAYGEIRANYIVAQKAQIYWGINDIENYSLHDLMIVESLYESRNNFAPSL